MQEWEEDPREEEPGFWSGLFYPNRYKRAHPYKNDDEGFWSDEYADKITLWNNENLLWCGRFPEWDSVSKKHTCGEYAEQD